MSKTYKDTKSRMKECPAKAFQGSKMGFIIGGGMG